MLVHYYPDCLAFGAALTSPVCIDARRNIWAFRLALAMLPPLVLFIALILPAVCCARVLSRRRVRTLATHLALTIAEEGEHAKRTRLRCQAARLDAGVPESDRTHQCAANGSASLAAQRSVFGGGWRRQPRAQISSLDALAADWKSAERARRRAEKLRRRRAAAAAVRVDRAAATASAWLTAGDAAPEGSAGNGVGVGVVGGIGGLLRMLTPTANRAFLELIAASKASAEGAEEEGDDDEALRRRDATRLLRGVQARSRLEAAADDLESISRSQRAASDLHELATDTHDGDAAVLPTEGGARAAELVALSEATFWNELAHAVPALIDLIVISGATEDDESLLRIGRALRSLCRRCVYAAERPGARALVADHGHPRLLGLGYAPLVREVHRPLLLRFLVGQGTEVDELRTREPMRVVRLEPPSFMGPPATPPLGAMAKPPSRLPEPRQLVGSGRRRQGCRRWDGQLRAPPLNGTPQGGAWGSGPKAPPTALQRPSERSQLASRACDMIAPQKLATMSQLMRRVAAATDGLHVARSRSTKRRGAARRRRRWHQRRWKDAPLPWLRRQVCLHERGSGECADESRSA